MGAIWTILALVLWGCGIAGRVFVKRREFYRTNVAGLQTFRSYGNMVTTRFFESCVNIGSLLCFAFGLAVFIKAGSYW